MCLQPTSKCAATTDMRSLLEHAFGNPCVSIVAYPETVTTQAKGGAATQAQAQTGPVANINVAASARRFRCSCLDNCFPRGNVAVDVLHGLNQLRDGHCDRRVERADDA